MHLCDRFPRWIASTAKVGESAWPAAQIGGGAFGLAYYHTVMQQERIPKLEKRLREGSPEAEQRGRSKSGRSRSWSTLETPDLTDNEI